MVSDLHCTVKDCCGDIPLDEFCDRCYQVQKMFEDTLNAFIQVCPDNHTWLFATAKIDCPMCKENRLLKEILDIEKIPAPFWTITSYRNRYYRGFSHGWNALRKEIQNILKGVR